MLETLVISIYGIAALYSSQKDVIDRMVRVLLGPVGSESLDTVIVAVNQCQGRLHLSTYQRTDRGPTLVEGISSECIFDIPYLVSGWLSFTGVDLVDLMDTPSADTPFHAFPHIVERRQPRRCPVADNTTWN